LQYTKDSSCSLSLSDCGTARDGNGDLDIASRRSTATAYLLRHRATRNGAVVQFHMATTYPNSSLGRKYTYAIRPTSVNWN